MKFNTNLTHYSITQTISNITCDNSQRLSKLFDHEIENVLQLHTFHAITQFYFSKPTKKYFIQHIRHTVCNDNKNNKSNDKEAPKVPNTLH